MFDAEQRQWWYAGMRAIGFALLDQGIGAHGPGRDMRFLDAGCGSGLNLLHLSRRGRAFGVDVSQEALRLCRERGVSAVLASVERLPVATESVDCVTSFDVLYHRWIRDDAAAVAEMARVLRPGGLALVRVPAFRALWGAHDDAVLSRHRYTLRELESLLQRGGFDVWRSSYCNFFLLPLVYLRRRLDRATGREGSDVGLLPVPFEWGFRKLLELEARIIRRVRMPIGTSALAVARKRPGAL